MKLHNIHYQIKTKHIKIISNNIKHIVVSDFEKEK